MHQTNMNFGEELSTWMQLTTILSLEQQITNGIKYVLQMEFALTTERLLL
jgi:hypothetical protein